MGFTHLIQPTFKEEVIIFKLLKKLFTPKTKPTSVGKIVASGADYGITAEQFSRYAVDVVRRLQQAGYEAYIVGGGVRDTLFSKHPKDFDVATNAKPEQVRDLFRNCRLIGRRFRLAHVFFGREIIEVATFRAEHHKGSKAHGQVRGGMIVRDNVYGSLEEDAVRRDFTINALYYNPIDNTIIDYTNALNDIANKQLQIIGEASKRYREDPVRMLRALRFASKLNLTIAENTLAPLDKSSHLLRAVPPARLFEEVLKLFLTGHSVETFQALQEHNFFQYLFPDADKCLKNNPVFTKLIKLALINTDQRIHESKSVMPAFLLAVFLWQPLQEAAERYRHEGAKGKVAYDQAARDVLKSQADHVAIIKRISEIMREIWHFQTLLNRRHENLAFELMQQRGFRAGYDFLLLRATAGEPVGPLAQWWTTFIAASHEEREQMAAAIPKPKFKKRRRKPKPS